MRIASPVVSPAVRAAAALALAAGLPALASCTGCAPASSTHASAANGAVARADSPDPADAGLPALPPPDAGVADAATAAAPLKELPRGGRQLFPEYRLVGFCGTPGAPALGELTGNLPVKAKALEAQGAKYGDSRKLMPAFELIAVVVQSYPGPDGLYRRRVDSSVVDQYLALARKSKGILLLNIQPGHSDFLTEVKFLESYLREPDVGLALDPEWSMKANQKPGVFYGNTTGAVINDVAEYLSSIIAQGNLPEKALVYHQVNDAVFREDDVLKGFPGVALIKSVDGLGPIAAKMNTYRYLVKKINPCEHPGFKLFFDEDTRDGHRMMTPKEVLSLTPQPEYVMYE